MSTRKAYNGPFGNYHAGSAGAVLNAACEQEGRGCDKVGNYIIGNGVLYSNSSCKTVVAKFRWEGDDIIFEWVTQ